MDAMTLALIPNGAVASQAALSPSHAFLLLAPILLPAIACIVWLVAWAIAQNRQHS